MVREQLINNSDGFYDGLPGQQSKSKINQRCFFTKEQLKEQKLILMEDEQKLLIERADELRQKIEAAKSKDKE